MILIIPQFADVRNTKQTNFKNKNCLNPSKINGFKLKSNICYCKRVGRIPLKIDVSKDTGNGITFERTTLSPDKLPTMTLLGIIKKNTAAAMIKVPIVIIPYCFIFFVLKILFYHAYHSTARFFYSANFAFIQRHSIV